MPRPPLPAATIDRWLAPLMRFLHIEAASGVVLLVCTAVALGLANSPAAGWFAGLWKTPISLSFGAFTLSGDVGHLIINDGLMTIFFFVVGLEVKRDDFRPVFYSGVGWRWLPCDGSWTAFGHTVGHTGPPAPTSASGRDRAQEQGRLRPGSQDWESLEITPLEAPVDIQASLRAG